VRTDLVATGNKQLHKGSREEIMNWLSGYNASIAIHNNDIANNCNANHFLNMK